MNSMIFTQIKRYFSTISAPPRGVLPSAQAPAETEAQAPGGRRLVPQKFCGRVFCPLNAIISHIFV